MKVFSQILGWIGRPERAAAADEQVAPSFDPRVTEDDVRAAYRLLLRRAPDPDGWHNYTAMVGRAEVAELTAALLCSEEFRRSPMHDALVRREHADLRPVELAGGVRLLVSPHDLLNWPLFENAAYEEHLAAAVAETLRPGDTVCCVGANIGCHALRAARRVGPRGRVVAFEARPQTARLLQINASLNGASNLIVIPLAVADRCAAFRYVRAQGTNGFVEPVRGGAFAPGCDLEDDDTLVQAVRLDDLEGLLSPLRLLQIDAEGAEGLVLRGAARMLARDRPTILAELCLGQLSRTSHVTGEDFLRPLVELGYALEVVGFDGVRVPFGTDVRALVGYARAQPTSQIDICCLPELRASSGAASVA